MANFYQQHFIKDFYLKCYHHFNSFISNLDDYHYVVQYLIYVYIRYQSYLIYMN